MSEWPVWLVPLVALCGVVPFAVLIVRRRIRSERRRKRQLNVLKELDDLGINELAVLRRQDNQAPAPLGQATVARRKGQLARRGTSFIVSPHEPTAWPDRTGFEVLIRFEDRGARYEVRCLAVGQGKLTAIGRRRLGLESKTIWKLRPKGVIVKRERRDMMRFYLGDASAAPPGVVDARRFLDMHAWLMATDLRTDGSSRLPVRLRDDAFERHMPAENGKSGQSDQGPAADGDPAAPPSAPQAEMAGGSGPQGLAVDVLDFSGGGLQVEVPLRRIAQLWPEADEADSEQIFEALSDRMLHVDLAVHLDFPDNVGDLEPHLPPRLWFLVELARVSLMETDENDAEEEQVCLGLAVVYQPQETDPVTGRPHRWARIGRGNEADDLVALHSALNQAAAQMDVTKPGPGGHGP